MVFTVALVASSVPRETAPDSARVAKSPAQIAQRATRRIQATNAHRNPCAACDKSCEVTPGILAYAKPMPTVCPVAIPALPAARPAARADARMGCWRYTCVRPRSRWTLASALLISAAVHSGLLFGLGHMRKKPVVRRDVPTIQLAITMPLLKELEE